MGRSGRSPFGAGLGLVSFERIDSSPGWDKGISLLLPLLLLMLLLGTLTWLRIEKKKKKKVGVEVEGEDEKVTVGIIFFFFSSSHFTSTIFFTDNGLKE